LATGRASAERWKLLITNHFQHPKDIAMLEKVRNEHWRRHEVGRVVDGGAVRMSSPSEPLVE
jgi:hypothetical protein